LILVKADSNLFAMTGCLIDGQGAKSA